jgi:hypothetical protein
MVGKMTNIIFGGNTPTKSLIYFGPKTKKLSIIAGDHRDINHFLFVQHSLQNHLVNAFSSSYAFHSIHNTVSFKQSTILIV